MTGLSVWRRTDEQCGYMNVTIPEQCVPHVIQRWVAHFRELIPFPVVVQARLLSHDQLVALRARTCT